MKVSDSQVLRNRKHSQEAFMVHVLVFIPNLDYSLFNFRQYSALQVAQ